MSKSVLFLMISVNLCISQIAQSGTLSSANTDSFNKNIAFEILTGIHYTGEYQTAFYNMIFPDYMLYGGVRIVYQPKRCIVLSLTGSYSHAGDLDFFRIGFGFPTKMDLTYIDTDFKIRYVGSLSSKLECLIGIGMNDSYLRVFQTFLDTVGATYNVVSSSHTLRPLISAGLKVSISDHLYTQLQTKIAIHHLCRIGEVRIRQNDVSPSVSLGVGYTFVL